MILDLKAYGNSVIKRLFSVIDLTKDAMTEKDKDDISKFISKLIIEVEGSLEYFSHVKYGSRMQSVLMKLNGVKNINDFQIRRCAMLDSIEIINKIIVNL